MNRHAQFTPIAQQPDLRSHASGAALLEFRPP